MAPTSAGPVEISTFATIVNPALVAGTGRATVPAGADWTWCGAGSRKDIFCVGNWMLTQCMLDTWHEEEINATGSRELVVQGVQRHFPVVARPQIGVSSANVIFGQERLTEQFLSMRFFHDSVIPFTKRCSSPSEHFAFNALFLWEHSLCAPEGAERRWAAFAENSWNGQTWRDPLWILSKKWH